MEKNSDEVFITFMIERELNTYKDTMYFIDTPFGKKLQIVWKLTHLPSRNKAIRCKWVFEKKLHLDGTIEKYKARLVAEGFI